MHELPAETEAGLRLLIERLGSLPNTTMAADHPALLYMDTWLSSESDAATKYRLRPIYDIYIIYTIRILQFPPPVVELPRKCHKKKTGNTIGRQDSAHNRYI